MKKKANSSFPQEYEEQLSTDIRMTPLPLEAQAKTTNGAVRIGIAADHGGFKLKEFLVKLLSEANYKVHQCVEDDNMNMICLGGRVITESLAGELANIFLKARFSGSERHNRRLAKVAAIENRNK